MAREPSAVMHAGSVAAGRMFHPLAAFFALTAFMALAGGCSGQPDMRPEQFVGKWKSSRLATPLHLYKNGEWEIKTEEDSVLQFGLWQLQARRMVWIVKIDGRLSQDPNAIVSVGQRQFVLREQDGSVTRFERMD